MVFLVLLGIPLIVAVAGFIWLDGITWKEFLVQVGAQLIVAGASMLIMYYASTYDTEVWNGIVVEKKMNWVSCSHSYPCNCRTTCDSKNNCSTTCDTCYEHTWDYDWDVYTSNGEEITIDRIDRQGRGEPPRWTAVKIGEPTAYEHGYTSYIKAAPDSLFRHQGLVEKYAGTIPKYPDRIYDYYHLNRLVLVGVTMPDVAKWNEDLEKINSELGAAKQVNMVVVLTDKPRDWFYALEESWIGGKKNDVVLVIGVDASLKPQWSEVMAWTTEKLFQVKLRDAVMDLPTVERAKTIRLLRDTTGDHFKRQPMAEFEYLKASIVPSATGWVVSLLIGLLVAAGLTYLFHLHDVFGGNNPFRRRRQKNPVKSSWGLGRRRKPSFMRW